MQSLISQLGAPQFRNRERAMAQLNAIGLPALPALNEAREHDDPEIQARATILYKRLVDSDLSTRLEEFIAGNDDGGSLDGWDYFRNNLGDTPVGRRLFADATRSFPELMRALENDDPTRIPANETIEQLQHKQRVELKQLSESDVVAAFLPILEHQPNLSARAQFALSTLLMIRPFTSAISESGKQEIFERLGSAWVRRSPPETWRDALNAAMIHELSGGYDLAKQILSMPDVDMESLQYATMAVGRFGSRRDIALLRPFFDDARVLDVQEAYESDRKGLQTQVRDIALAVAIRLAGGDLAQAGFPEATVHPNVYVVPSTIGFHGGADEPREKAIEYLNSLVGNESAG